VAESTACATPEKTSPHPVKLCWVWPCPRSLLYSGTPNRYG